VTGSTTSPFGIDTKVPTTARMYDYWLGDHDNFAADRAAALRVSEAAPEAQLMAIENRRFLRRAERYLAAAPGIIQFLDIGTGLPTARIAADSPQRGIASGNLADTCGTWCSRHDPS
jgi:hypothetical protein